MQNDVKYTRNDLECIYRLYNDALYDIRQNFNRTYNFMLENMVEEGLGG